jgi:5-methylthioadenosine/S-adenosylhomocysteine deaminase
LVIPGLVDLHNHLAYNTLPLWTEPKQHTPFLHYNSWTKAVTYAASTTWPAYALITACP